MCDTSREQVSEGNCTRKQVLIDIPSNFRWKSCEERGLFVRGLTPSNRSQKAFKRRVMPWGIPYRRKLSHTVPGNL